MNHFKIMIAARKNEKRFSLNHETDSWGGGGQESMAPSRFPPRTVVISFYSAFTHFHFLSLSPLSRHKLVNTVMQGKLQGG